MGNTFHEAEMMAQLEIDQMAERDRKGTKLFEVTLYKPVSDVLRAFVTVEAATPEEAAAAALKLDMSEIDFAFYACGDNSDEITAEVTGECSTS